MKVYKYKCDCCGVDFESTWKRREDTHVYCSYSCSAKGGGRGRKHSEATKTKISESLLKHNRDNKKKHQYVCDKCGCTFERCKKIKAGLPIRCSSCKRNVKHAKDIDTITSIKMLSSRTVSKILHRSGVGCAICGWREAACDVHHIKSRKSGGGDEHANLIILCPNCHRKIHSKTATWSKEFLVSRSIATLETDLLAFYHPSN